MTEISRPEFNWDEASYAFKAAKELTDQISDQNARYAEVQAIFENDPEIRDLASEGISEEQAETFVRLYDFNGQYGPIFEELGKYSLGLDSQLEEADKTVLDTVDIVEKSETELGAKKEERENQLRNDALSVVQSVERLAPKALARVQSLLDRRISESAADGEIADFEKRLSDARTRLLVLQDKYDHIERQSKLVDEANAANEPWPLPLALIQGVGIEATIQAMIDELPVEPTLSESAHGRFVELKRFNVDQPEASIYAALYFTEYPGRTITVEELVEFLYPESVIEQMSDYHMRSRVTTILGPENGEIVRRILADEGFVLQYGWRKRLEKNGGGHIKIVDRKRIYRALPASLSEMGLSNTADGDDYRDEFEVLPPLNTVVVQEAQTTELGIDVSIAEDEVSVSVESVDSDQPAGELLDTDKSSQPEDAIPVIPSPLPEARVAEIRVAETTPRKPTLAKKVTKSSTPERRESWEIRLKKEIGQALNELEELGMLSDRAGVKRRTAYAMTRSAKWCTQTSVQKLADSGVTSRDSRMQSRNPDFILSPDIMVFLKLFNTSDDLAKSSPHQRRAIRLVHDAVASYFEHRS